MASKRNRKKPGCKFINVCLTTETIKTIKDVQNVLRPNKVMEPTQADALEKIISEWRADKEIINAEIVKR